MRKKGVDLHQNGLDLSLLEDRGALDLIITSLPEELLYPSYTLFQLGFCVHGKVTILWNVTERNKLPLMTEIDFPRGIRHLVRSTLSFSESAENFLLFCLALNKNYRDSQTGCKIEKQFSISRFLKCRINDNSFSCLQRSFECRKEIPMKQYKQNSRVSQTFFILFIGISFLHSNDLSCNY